MLVSSFLVHEISQAVLRPCIMLQTAFLLSHFLIYRVLGIVGISYSESFRGDIQVLWTVGVRSAPVPELAALCRASTSTQLMLGMS